MTTKTLDKNKYFKYEDWKDTITKIDNPNSWVKVLNINKSTEEKSSSDFEQIYCGLISNEEEYLKESLRDFKNWELMIDNNYPGFWVSGGEKTPHYDKFGRFPEDSHLEPFVFYRTFYDLKEPYAEISEEFIHYHKLYFDKNKNEYIHINESGEEEVAARIIDNAELLGIEIKVKYIKDFLAAKGMCLVVYYACCRYSDKELTDVFPQDFNESKITDKYAYEIDATPDDRMLHVCKLKGYSDFKAKSIIVPFPEPLDSFYQSIVNDKKKEKRVSFIIDMDEKGKLIEKEATEHLPRDLYLTPIYFKREVMDEYYNCPSKYRVDASQISCGLLWGITYGQSPSNLIHAWLGDLGRDLPYIEQLRWRKYNVQPDGPPGKVTIKQELLAEFPDENEYEQIEHHFKKVLSVFNQKWHTKFGWYLFKPLRKNDNHYFTSLRVPTSEDPLKLEQQILNLAKILPDSLNQKELKKLSSKEYDGSISYLEDSLVNSFGISNQDSENTVKPLRIIQDLRSSGTAHRKSKDFGKKLTRMGIDKKSKIDFFYELLQDLINMLDTLSTTCNI